VDLEEVIAMPDNVLLAARALRDALIGFEPARWSGRDCAEVVEELARTEKACAAARARAAVRAADCGAHSQRGFADAADWLARRTGQSRAEARSALDTAEAVDDCPATRAALVAGELSLGQADEIARTEKEVPGSEAELLPLAKEASLASLKDQARKKRLGAVNPEELHNRQRAARRFRHWRDELGMVCFTAALTPEIGLPFINRLEAETDRGHRQAHRKGNDESREAHAADAFAILVQGQGGGRAGRADLVVVCDLAAYRRGHAHPGEACHLVGGGPVPVEVARQLSADAFLKAVVHDGVRIDTVAHFGRHIPAELRTALELGAPPGLDGVSCAEAGCERRYHLEWDHVNPVANGGETSFDNLKPRCWPHHRDKTERDRAAGLLNGGGGGSGPP
jgi:hypothetical protein